MLISLAETPKGINKVVCLSVYLLSSRAVGLLIKYKSTVLFVYRNKIVTVEKQNYINIVFIVQF